MELPRTLSVNNHAGFAWIAGAIGEHIMESAFSFPREDPPPTPFSIQWILRQLELIKIHTMNAGLWQFRQG